ncbi:MAG: alpha-ketoglutarate-dependent dioxygenase AlkB [Sphingobacteriales bacterium]|nr:MAG: alpha-ketoglutarate-dependent dioxygenase AlkB [Sphingobacteriales bacterium]
MNGLTYIDEFIDNSDELLKTLMTTVEWDTSMKARKTASYGKAYDYSQIAYPYQEFLPELENINEQLATTIGFKPNNCLINLYDNGESKMGYHSDQTEILVPNTGIAIISLGAIRTLKFRNIANPEQRIAYELNNGSLTYMTQELQTEWQHAIPRSDTDKPRISLTFRQIR